MKKSIALLVGLSALWFSSAEAETIKVSVWPDEVLTIDGDTVCVWSNACVGSLVLPTVMTECQLLVVAGGGGGGTAGGSGGGAGGVVASNDCALAAGTYTFIVGAGGAGTVDYLKCGENGENSSFGGVEAVGGGGGGGCYVKAPGKSGGSGGGGSDNNGTHYDGGVGLQPTSSSGGFGHSGGTAKSNWRTAGGGGAGGEGTENQNQSGLTTGGAGYVTTIFGGEFALAGGGGGGATTTCKESYGSAGGGSGGLLTSSTTGEGTHGGDATTPGSGGGGGGFVSGNHADKTLPGGSGANGMVVIRFHGKQDIVRYKEPFLIPEAIGAKVKAVKGGYLMCWTNVGAAAGNAVRIRRNCEAELLVVGGGGGGGGNAASGGGAGGVVYANRMTLVRGDYKVVVGAGGAGGQGDRVGVKGSDSSFESIVALGGGFGNSCYSCGDASGGSGGGGVKNEYYHGGAALQPESPSGGLGNPGGDTKNDWRTTGGGGAGSPGCEESTGTNGMGKDLGNQVCGGAGFLCAISGEGRWYAGGGGGGATTTCLATLGANGGGHGGLGRTGTSGIEAAVRGGDATTPGSGGGGGGFAQTDHSLAVGGAGADGIVILKVFAPPRGLMLLMR